MALLCQFERELIGERVRANSLFPEVKGMWMGGTVPLGYDVKDRKLVINDSEARIVVYASGATVAIC